MWQFVLCSLQPKPLPMNGGVPRIAPASLWTRPKVQEFIQHVKTDPSSVLVVGRGETMTVRVPTHEGGKCMYVHWYYQSIQKDDPTIEPTFHDFSESLPPVFNSLVAIGQCDPMCWDCIWLKGDNQPASSDKRECVASIHFTLTQQYPSCRIELVDWLSVNLLINSMWSDFLTSLLKMPMILCVCNTSR